MQLSMNEALACWEGGSRRIPCPKSSGLCRIAVCGVGRVRVCVRCGGELAVMHVSSRARMPSDARFWGPLEG
jgi:hypothetical protein